MEQNKTESTIPFLGALQKTVPILLALGVITAMALSFGLVVDFDQEIGHFEFGAATFYVLVFGIAASAVLSVVLGLRARKRFSLFAFPESTPLSPCASYFAGLMALVTSAASLYSIFVLKLDAESTAGLVSAALFPALTVSMILGSHERTRMSAVRVVFGLLAALSVNINMFACYFNFALPLNSPVRNIITVVQAGVLLLLLSEIRLALSPEQRAASGFLVFTSAFAASAVLGISFGLCVYGFVSADAVDMGISVYRFACYFGVGLVGLSRIRALADSAGKYSSPNPPDSDDKFEEDNLSNP